MFGSALVRLFLISATAIITLIIVLFTLRMVGLSREHQPLSYPALSEKPLWFCLGGDQQKGPKNSAPAFEACLESSPHSIPVIELQRSKDGHFIISQHKLLEEGSQLKGPSFLYTLEELKKTQWFNPKNPNEIQKAPLSLNEALNLIKDRTFAINLTHKDPAQYEGLPEILKQNKKDEKVIFYSLYHDPLKYMRKELPRALFSINTHHMGQLIVMHSLFIEPFARLKGDLIIAPYKYRGQELFTPRILNEIERRQIPIYLLNNPKTDQVPTWLKEKVSGWAH